MSPKSVWTAVVAATLGIPLGASAGWAQDTRPEPPKWEFEFTPYLWMPAFSGDVGAGRGPTADVDASFGDIIENLDFAGMAMFEARRDRWGFLLDGLFSKLSADGESPIPIFNRTDVVIRTGLVESGVAYRVLERHSASIDVFGGARVWITDLEVKLSGNGQTPLTFADTQVWADPVVGGRVLVRLGERWSATLLGDIGGFGIGSDLTWQVFAGLSYDLDKTWSLKAGYRALGVDYTNGGFEADAVLHGPLVGLGIRF